MPAGTQIEDYDRYYAYGTFENQVMVIGLFVLRSDDLNDLIVQRASPIPAAPGAFRFDSLDNFPDVDGGGCSVLRLLSTFDALIRGERQRLSCNAPM
jgi:hypothetical protein